MAKHKKNDSALHKLKGISQPQSINKKGAELFKEKRKNIPNTKSLMSQLLKGDKIALSRAITRIESTAAKHQEEAKKIIKSCLPYANKSFRIGITGVPGVGKSTFIERLGKLFIEKGYRVAVLAIDPSSTVSKGSILGDKTRMEALVKEQNAFIRPTPAGDSLGGVARKTRETITLCEAAGFDIILIETVGVGQSETAVHAMTDFFLLLKLAGAGDELQGIKRGIIEMADAIIINKADGENLKAAQIAKTQFNNALHLFPPKESGWTPQTKICSALENKGIKEIYELLILYKQKSQKNGFFNQKRLEQNKYWLIETINNELKQNFFGNPAVKKELEKQLKALLKNKSTPFEAADTLLNKYFNQ